MKPFFSHSFHDTDDQCRYLGYLNYFALGTGIVPRALDEALGIGIMFHDLIAAPDNIDDAVLRCRTEMRKSAADFDINAAMALAEALVRGWRRVRKPYYDENFTDVETEHEHWLSTHGGQRMGVRCDLLKRRNSDGMLHIIEFKTRGTKGFTDELAYSSQSITETAAIEQAFGEPCQLIYECIYKGRRRQNAAGDWVIDDNPLVRAYGNTDGDVGWAKLKGYERYNPWDVHPPTDENQSRAIAGWIAFLPLDIVTQQFSSLPVIREYSVMQRYLRRIGKRQAVISEALSRELSEEQIDEIFPPILSQSCKSNKYHKACPYLEHCFEGFSLEDMMASDFVAREPHYLLEKEAKCK